MTASLDPKFFQILPTRALSTEVLQDASKKRSLTALPQVIEPDATPLWDELRQRVARLRPELSAKRLDRLTTSLRDTLSTSLATHWQHAQRVIAHAAGDALAISIVGPLAESPAAINRLMAELDDQTLEEELCARDAPKNHRAPTVEAVGSDFPAHAMKSVGTLEPALDAIERVRSRQSSLDHACITTVRSLVRERCAPLVPPVRMAIEKNLSFEMAATSEIVRAAPKSTSVPDPSNTSSQAIVLALHDGDIDTAAQILADGTEISPRLARRVIAGRDARAIMAMAWKSGLPASMASAIQIHLAMIPPSRAILPLQDGAYALTPGELNWQVDFLKEKLNQPYV